MSSTTTCAVGLKQDGALRVASCGIVRRAQLTTRVAKRSLCGFTALGQWPNVLHFYYVLCIGPGQWCHAVRPNDCPGSDLQLHALQSLAEEPRRTRQRSSLDTPSRLSLQSPRQGVEASGASTTSTMGEQASTAGVNLNVSGGTSIAGPTSTIGEQASAAKNLLSWQNGVSGQVPCTYSFILSMYRQAALSFVQQPQQGTSPLSRCKVKQMSDQPCPIIASGQCLAGND